MTAKAETSFRAMLQDGDVFKKVVESIKELCEQCNFECTAEGIECQSMDSSHVSLVSLSLHATGFSEYECEDDITLGVNLANLSKMLKCSSAKDSLTIHATDNENVKFTFENEAANTCFDSELKLMTVDEEHLAIPETEYKCIVTMPSNDFAKICRDLQTIGESVTISATKAGVQFSVKGDIGSGEMLRRQNETNDESSITIELEEPINQQFALRYLNSFAKSSVLSNRVTLSMSDGVPLQVEFKMDDLGSVKYFLAPKIEDEDN